MNQTRLFLLLAWLMVATLLWMEWSKERLAPPEQPAAQSALPQARDGAVPAAPVAPGAVAATGAAPAGASTPVTVRTDVLQAVLDGGEVEQADLLAYPATAGGEPVRLLQNGPRHFFVAQSGWVSRSNPAPTHQAGFVPAGPARDYRLADGAASVEVPFVWHGPDGVSIRRTYTFTRGQYAVQVRDEVLNRGTQPWQGAVYRQLTRSTPPPAKTGMMSGSTFAFEGAAWYSPQDKYEKRPFKDFADEAALAKPVTGGWVALLQHHFFTAWIPSADAATTFETATLQGPGGVNYVIREVGPAVSVAPGQQAALQARLWIGPKLVEQIQAQKVPGLERAVDFSSYSVFATLAGWLFSVLAWLHGLIGNWGWAIVGLVVLIKLVLLPLSAAQYRSMAKMRLLQPKLAQLKERHGEDRQQFQMAMMELYRKEKVNPLGGCLPVLVQMPIFLALYWMLSESVELRHAPWIGWIHDLTARDPYFVLPAINLVVMWLTQRLTPMAGVDPMQQRMMQFMPLVFGVMFAFFPAGLVLYWVTNGLLTLLQQWWFIRKYGTKAPAKA